MNAADLDLIARVARRMVTGGTDQESQMLGHHVLCLVEEYEGLRSRLAALNRVAFLTPATPLAEALAESE